MDEADRSQGREASSYLERAFTLPNLLTLLRVALLPFILLTLLRGEGGLAAVLISVAFASDALDGWLARRLNQISDMGKILDPLIDKVTVGSIVVLLVLLRGFPTWIASLMILRDVIILSLGGFLVRRRRVILTSNVLGKATGSVFAATIILYTLNIQPLGRYLSLISVGFVLASSASYLVRFMGILSPQGRTRPQVPGSSSPEWAAPGALASKGGR